MGAMNDALKEAALRALERRLGYGTTIVQTSGQGGGRGINLTYTVSGMDLPPEVMEIIAKSYLTAARRYFTDRVVLVSSPYRTGQTAGQIHPRNTRVFPNRFTFSFPDDKRSGDVKKRKQRAEEMGWMEFRFDQRIGKKGKPLKPKMRLPWETIQRGPRKGQRWQPPTYQDVAKGLDAVKSVPVILLDREIIKKAFIEGFRRALRRMG